MTLMNLCDGTRLTAHYDQVEEVHSMESSTPISVLPIGPPVILWHQWTHTGVVADRITHRVAAALLEYHGIPDAWDDHFQYGPYRPPQPTTT